VQLILQQQRAEQAISITGDIDRTVASTLTMETLLNEHSELRKIRSQHRL